MFNNRDREQFYTPSRELFDDFCQSLVDRYDLHGMIKQGTVTKLSKQEGVFAVELGEEVVFAKRVVCALGNTNVKNIPEWAVGYPDISHAIDFIDRPISIPVSVQTKLNQQTPSDPPPTSGKSPLKKPANARLLVVGGGLTSAQLVQQALDRGFKDVTLITRGKLQIKQFDLNLEWVGKTSYVQFAKFWTEDSRSRLGMLKNAKSGGSITPEYHLKIKKWVQEGVLTLLEHTKITGLEFSDEYVVSFGKKQERYDLIWLGTGSKADISTDPLFKEVMNNYPIETSGGLPFLTKGIIC